MKTRIIAFLSVLVLVSMVLAACGGQATEAPVVEEPAPAEPVEEPAPEEPVVEEPAPVVIEPAGAARQRPLTGPRSPLVGGRGLCVSRYRKGFQRATVSVGC